MLVKSKTDSNKDGEMTVECQYMLLFYAYHAQLQELCVVTMDTKCKANPIHLEVSN